MYLVLNSGNKVWKPSNQPCVCKINLANYATEKVTDDKDSIFGRLEKSRGANSWEERGGVSGQSYCPYDTLLPSHPLSKPSLMRG